MHFQHFENAQKLLPDLRKHLNNSERLQEYHEKIEHEIKLTKERLKKTVVIKPIPKKTTPPQTSMELEKNTRGGQPLGQRPVMPKPMPVLAKKRPSTQVILGWIFIVLAILISIFILMQ
ncbi:MAG: hypothetical protein IPM82_07380 [Saprospiraceae bacterium]|nr:hypothetical protein [Saprospiraceae bacterium]